jgi:hypothetical protein
VFGFVSVTFSTSTIGYLERSVRLITILLQQAFRQILWNTPKGVKTGKRETLLIFARSQKPDLEKFCGQLKEP